MLLTEEEAKTKICPIMSSNLDTPPYMCVGKSCMCWRWGSVKDVDIKDDPKGGLSIEEAVKIRPDLVRYVGTRDSDKRRLILNGYCGNGGDPEKSNHNWL